MVYAGRTSDGGLMLNLQTIPGIPGNGVAIPGQELTGGQNMFMALIPPTPEDGKQVTIDHLIGEFIQPHVSGEEQVAEIREILGMYSGLEADTIFCLSYALRGGRFEEATSRFKDFHRDFLNKRGIPDWMRCTSEKTFDFFNEMYKLVEAERYR